MLASVLLVPLGSVFTGSLDVVSIGSGAAGFGSRALGFAASAGTRVGAASDFATAFPSGCPFGLPGAVSVTFFMFFITALDLGALALTLIRLHNTTVSYADENLNLTQNVNIQVNSITEVEFNKIQIMNCLKLVQKFITSFYLH